MKTITKTEGWEYDWKLASQELNKGLRFSRNPLFLFMAGSKGLEPSASGVTGRRYNQLNYDPAKMVGV